MTALLGQKVRVHLNLHNGLYSVKLGKEPIMHFSEVYLRNVTFLVSAAGQARALREQCRHVHAWLEGIWHEVPADPPPSNLFSYSYQLGPFFYAQHDYSLVHSAEEAYLTPLRKNMNLELASIKTDKDQAGHGTAKFTVDGVHCMDVTFDPAEAWPTLAYSGHKKAAELYEKASQEFTRPSAQHAHIHAYIKDKFDLHLRQLEAERERKEILQLIKTKTVYLVYKEGEDISQVPLSGYTAIDTKFAPKVAKHLRESYALFDKLVYIINERFADDVPQYQLVKATPEGQMALGLAA